MLRLSSSRRRGAIAILVTLAAALTLAACAPGQPTPITKEAGSVRSYYTFVFWAGLVIFLGVEGAIIAMLVRYRRRKNDDGSIPEQIHGNTKLEIVWTVLPTILVIVLFAFSWRTLDKLETVSPKPDLKIDAIGKQWVWDFDYTGTGVVVNGQQNGPPTELVVPTGQTIEFNLKSNDVIHSFYIPNALYKLDVVPGQKNRFDAEFTKTGTYPGRCAELCGLAHSAMLFTVKVVTPAEFKVWLAKEKAKVAANPPTTTAPSATGGGASGSGGGSAAGSETGGGAKSEGAATNATGGYADSPAPSGSAPASSETGKD